VTLVGNKLLLISRDTVQGALDHAPDEPSVQRIFRLFATLSRQGYHLLLTAPEPERWVPTRGSVDDALNSQNTLMERTRAAGGELEGVYYVPRSLLTQDRNREGALVDILKRYSMESADTVLLSSSSPFLKAASRLGIATLEVGLPGKQGESLSSALKRLL
jgi:hypothetical protein